MKKLYKDKGYNLLENEYKSNKVYMTFEKEGYLYYNTYNGFMKTNNPKKWSIKNPYSLQNIQKWIYDNGGDCFVVSEKYNCDTIRLQCNCGNIYEVGFGNFVTTRQFSCPSCGKKRGGIKHRKDDIYLAKLKELGITLLEEYTGCKNCYYMKTSDGYYIRSCPWNIFQGMDYKDTTFDTCNKYSIENMKHWIQENCPDISLLSTKYEGAKAIYLFRCGCGREFKTSWQAFRFSEINRCPNCSKRQSLLELKTEQWLIENNIVFEREKVFQDCKYLRPLKFDYYLPQFNTVIEADGRQHTEPIRFGNMTNIQAKKQLKTNKIRDKIKDNYCLKNNIRMIRIPYYEFKTDNYKKILKNIYG